MPPSDYLTEDERLARLIHRNAGPERIWTGGRWTEGPAYVPAGRYAVWSDIPNDRVMRWDEMNGAVAVFEQPARNQNGHTVDREGRLVSCEHRGRCISRIEHDGTRTVLADRHEGKRLNSPNDLVVKSDGSIWFTDPDYGIISDYEGYRAEREQSGCFVYRVDPATGAVDKVADGFAKPNGLAFTPDETILYVADSGISHDPDGPHHIRAFNVGADGKLSRPRVFFEIAEGIPDGFRVDTEGNVWTSCSDGVICIDPAGTALGKIRIPQRVSNLAFGGARRNRLFITATKSLYAVFVGATGAQTP
jgi:gluconolactonase